MLRLRQVAPRRFVTVLFRLQRELGEPVVSTAVHTNPKVLRYTWPCGCSAVGVGGPKCLAERCERHS
ncbi:MAG TPA: hypothetical protein VMF61_04965 [Candidatus Acidoferrales bacterium]|nr:hypothetical protein [Candidatus Acidoferrales bacterium]